MRPGKGKVRRSRARGHGASSTQGRRGQLCMCPQAYPFLCGRQGGQVSSTILQQGRDGGGQRESAQAKRARTVRRHRNDRSARGVVRHAASELLSLLLLLLLGRKGNSSGSSCGCTPRCRGASCRRRSSSSCRIYRCNRVSSCPRPRQRDAAVPRALKVIRGGCGSLALPGLLRIPLIAVWLIGEGGCCCCCCGCGSQ
jgi:hypothetical protein